MNRADLIATWINAHGWTAGAELGIKAGPTMATILERCPKIQTYVAVDLWGPAEKGNPESYAGWNHEEYFASALEISHRHWPKVKILRGRTVDMRRYVPDESLDFVFIDADHSTAGVMADIRSWSSALKQNGRSWLIGHDIDWRSVRTALEKLQIEYTEHRDNVWLAKKIPSL